MASAQLSGVRKQGTPACVSWASAWGASGTSMVTSGLAWPALSRMGLTARSGLKRADEPTTAITMSNSGASSRISSAFIMTSYLVPASVRSSTRPALPGICAACRLAMVASDGTCTVMPRTPSWSTTIAAPPPVVVTTATRWAFDCRAGIFCASGNTSNSVSSISTRATPRSLRKASAMSSSPASAPVWVAAISAAALERPSL